MTLLPVQLISGAALAAVIAFLSRALNLLTTAGALAAGLLGLIVFGVGGAPFAIPLLAFFLSSSFLSRIGRARKAHQQLHYDKTSTRDAAQVLANGGLAGLLVVLYALNLTSLPPRNAALLYLAALAAVNADTWATEIGGLWRGRPFLVTTFRRVDAGVSGAVSLPGLIASAAGAFFLVAAGWLVWPARSALLLWRPDGAEFLAIGWAGFVASFGDSILGASVQAQYRCSVCGHMTEAAVHCGHPGALKRGHPWITNDVVNFLTSLMGVLFAGALLSAFANPK